MGRQHIADLARADPESDRTESSMRGSVRISTRNGGSWLGNSLFRPDDMDDALLSAGKIKEGDAIFFTILPQRLDHFVGELIGKGFLAFIGRHDVIDSGKRPMRIEHFHAKIPKHSKSLRAGNFVNKMGADQQLSCSVWQFDAPRAPPILYPTTSCS